MMIGVWYCIWFSKLRQFNLGNFKKLISLQFCRAIAKKNGFFICDLFTGHGIGELVHLPPAVFHEKKPRSENPYVMQPGMVFTIEPIFTMR